jgi:hypothetical protein
LELLKNRACFLSSTGEGPSAAIVKRIKNAETKCQIFLHLRWILGKIPPPPLSFFVKETGDLMQTIVGSEEIDRELYHRNISHFSQVDSTPFAHGELKGKPTPMPQRSQDVLRELTFRRDTNLGVKNIDVSIWLAPWP